MCDGYAWSTQHARTVAWMECGAPPAWLSDDTNASNADRKSQTKQGTGQLTRLQAGVRSLFHAAVAGTVPQGLPAAQSPARR